MNESGPASAPETQGPDSPEDGVDLAVAAGQLLHALRGAIDQTLQLIAQEARLAVVSLAGILVLGLFVGIAVVFTWLLIAGAGVVWAVQMGIGWVPALLLSAAINFGVAMVAWFGIRWLSRNLSFRSTRRQFTADQSGEGCD